MIEVQRADAAARRHALVVVVLGALTGALLLVAFGRYRIPLRDWVLSEPEKLAYRAKLVVLVSGGLLSTPLIAFALYLWSLGAKVLRAGRFPPPGQRVIRDTPIVSGRAAMSRGRRLKILALCLGIASAILWLLLWRLASILRDGAA
jgi:hypothetical protein